MRESALESDLSPAEKLYGLSLLWREATYNFAFFDQVPDLDWEQAYREAIPRVLATDSLYHYYRELQRFCALLKDGHTSIHLPDAVRAVIGWPPLLLKAVRRRAIVINVDRALAPQVPLGSEIIAVEGKPTADYLASEVFPYISSSTEHIFWEWGIRDLLDGLVGTEVRITLRTPEQEVRELTLVRQPSTAERAWVAERRKRPEEGVEFRQLEEGIAYVALNHFALEEVVHAFEALLPSLYASRGLIFDLRNNTGGNSDYAVEVVKHLTDKPFLTSRWRTPEHIAAYKAWGQWADKVPELARYRPYAEGKAWHEEEPERIVPPEGPKITAPLVVLIGHNTASAAEDFLICLDSAKRATLVGQRTFGSTGQPLLVELPGGGMARICAKRDTYPDGRDFVGYGIQPDHFIEPSVEAFLAGQDVVLEKGIEVLKTMMD